MKIYRLLKEGAAEDVKKIMDNAKKDERNQHRF